MARFGRRASAHHEEDEGYFVSMSDMLTGLLFVFIILLLYFALQFKQTTEELTGANKARKELLEELQQRLQKQNLRVEIDPVTGVLRMSENEKDAILFASKSPNLTDQGRGAVKKVADALAAVLPCYTEDHPSLKCRRPSKSPYRIDALFIEGHTDKQSYILGGRDRNIDLSAERAINTYLAMLQRQPELDGLTTVYRGLGGKSDRPVPILSVSGYGSKRPVPGHDSFNLRDLSTNRRIDLRFLMATPDPAGIRNMLVK